MLSVDAIDFLRHVMIGQELGELACCLGVGLLRSGAQVLCSEVPAEGSNVNSQVAGWYNVHRRIHVNHDSHRQKLT